MNITLDMPTFGVIKRKLGVMSDKAPSVMYNVINRVASNVRKNISKFVLKRYIIKSEDVKKTVTISKRPSKADPTAIITSKGELIPLIKFRVKADTPIKKRPQPDYKAKVLKKSKLSVSRHSFVQQMPSGHIGIFRRKLISKELGSIVKGGKEKFKAIRELYGPSVPEMVGNEEVWKLIEKDAISMRDKRLEHEIKRLLEQ